MLFAAKDKLASYEVSVEGTIETITIYLVLVLLGMILMGATIGVVSSLLATRKYLKV
jgi:hypothetical protein